MAFLGTVRQTFARRQANGQVDVERQQGHPLEAAAAAQDAAAPPQPSSTPMTFLPSLPFFASSGGRTRQDAGSSPRPASSRYSETGDGRDDSSAARSVISPKTPQFPTSSTGAFPPETAAPGPGAVPAPIAAPPVAVLNEDENRQRNRRHHRWFRGADPAEVHLADLAEAGRRRRLRQRQRAEGQEGSSGNMPAPVPMVPPSATDTTTTTAATSSAAPSTAADKRFLFCFPAVRSRRMRAHLLRCCVSGLFAVLLLAVYAGLSATHNVTNSEFSVLLVLVLVVAAVVFVHSLVRVGLGLAHPLSPAEEAAAETRYQLRRRGGGGRGGSGTVADGPAALGFGQHYGAGGYALPRQPIRVVLARDEEVAGAASEAAKLQPPAYGLWRESVRVDPNRLYWQRNDAPTALGAIDENAAAGRRRSRSNSTGSTGGDREEGGNGRSSPRPPSYASDDGVSYVVEAQPRSIAPTTDVPLPPHPAEAGRTGGSAAW